MKIIEPITISPSEFFAFGAAPYPDYGWTHAYDLAQGVTIWDVATPYAVGARVISTVDQAVYEAATASTGVEPTTDAVKWVRLYRSNAWRAFDGAVGNPCRGYANGGGAQTGQNTLIFCLRPMQRFDTIALLNVRARYVVVTYENPDGEVYSRDLLTLDRTPIKDAWTYFFADCPIQRNIVFEDLAAWVPTDLSGTGGVLTIELQSTSSEVSVGEIVIGRGKSLGVTLDGANRRLVDYSGKDVSQYGEATLTQRAYSYQTAFDVSVPLGLASNIANAMEDIRATPVVVYPDTTSAARGLIAYGFPSDFTATYRTTEITFATLKIEGLI